eukprot:6811618-Prymnesium_polylepis.1
MERGRTSFVSLYTHEWNGTSFVSHARPRARMLIFGFAFACMYVCRLAACTVAAYRCGSLMEA